MSLTLASAIARAKNLLSDPGAWLALLEIQINNPSATVMRIVLNTENITWDGQTWTAFPFALDESRQTADGSIQGLAIRVSNVGRVVQQYVEEADGGSGSIVILRIVYSESLDLDAVLEEMFEVKSTCCIEELIDDNVMMWVVFELGAENLFARRFPQDVYGRQTCRRDFKSVECGYSGAETSCNKTLGRCIELGNQARFGNCPGIPGEGFDLDGTPISVADIMLYFTLMMSYDDATLSGTPLIVRFTDEETDSFVYVKFYPTISATDNPTDDQVWTNLYTLLDADISGAPGVIKIRSGGITHHLHSYPSIASAVHNIGDRTLSGTVLGHTTLSGVPRIGRIDVDGVPYYVKMYPTDY